MQYEIVFGTHIFSPLYLLYDLPNIIAVIIIIIVSSSSVSCPASLLQIIKSFEMYGIIINFCLLGIVLNYEHVIKYFTFIFINRRYYCIYICFFANTYLTYYIFILCLQKNNKLYVQNNPFYSLITEFNYYEI